MHEKTLESKEGQHRNKKAKHKKRLNKTKQTERGERETDNTNPRRKKARERERERVCECIFVSARDRKIETNEGRHGRTECVIVIKRCDCIQHPKRI